MKEAKKPFVLWLLGLSGAGKTTIANEIAKNLTKNDIKNERLDGDIIREVFPKTGFSRSDRIAHNKRIAWLASILERNGICTIVSFIAPYEESRKYARELCKNYVEVHVATDITECENRDVKGLYAKVRKGEIKNFTGIDDPFETPLNPDLVIDTAGQTVAESAAEVIDFIKKML